MNSIDVENRPVKIAKPDSLKSDPNAEDFSPSFPLSPVADKPNSVIGPTSGVTASSPSASTPTNNNNSKFNEQTIEKLSHRRKNSHNEPKQEGTGDQHQHDNGNFSDYALLRKLFPHHDKTVLLDALLSFDGSTVAAIQHLLANNIGLKNNAVERRLPHDFHLNSLARSRNDSSITGINNNPKNLLKDDTQAIDPQISFNSQKRSSSRRRSVEANTPPLASSLLMHGNNQISEMHTPMLPHGPPPHPMPHSHITPNFQSSKFSSYAAAQQAQQFYAQAHQRYLAAAAAAAASALQQAHPHGVGHQLNSPQNSLVLPPNISNTNQGGFLASNLLSRPDFAQYLSNAAQHHISTSSSRLGPNVGLASSNSSQSQLTPSNVLFNHSPVIPSLFQANANSGIKIYINQDIINYRNILGQN